MNRMYDQKGAGLIEVMVGLLVLAVGLLGFAGLQNASLAYSQKAYAYSQASFVAQDILERMRANRTAVANADYDLNYSDTPGALTDCSSSSCTALQMANWDLVQWTDLLRGTDTQSPVLPDADGSIVYTNIGGVERVVISIRYRLRESPGEDKDDASVNNAGQLYTYVMRTQI